MTEGITMNDSVLATGMNEANKRIEELEQEIARIPAMQRQFDRIDAALDASLDASREMTGEAMAQCVDREKIITDLAKSKLELTTKIAELEDRLADARRQVNDLEEELWTMPLDRAQTINAACLRLALTQLGIMPDPAKPPPSIAEYTLLELLEAPRVIKAAEDEEAKTRKPGEGYTLHTVCDDRLLAALYACQHYEGQEADEAEPIAVIGRKAIVVVNLPERRDGK